MNKPSDNSKGSLSKNNIFENIKEKQFVSECDNAKNRLWEFLSYYDGIDFANNFIEILDKVFDKKDVSGFVYIVYDKNTKLVKIGKTKNIKARMKTLSLSNPSLSLYGYMKCKDYSSAESFLHHSFCIYRIEREWFEIDPKIAFNELKNMQSKFGFNEVNPVCVDAADIVANAKKKRISA